MTRYEELKNKADNCRLTAAKLPEGFMKWVWLEHARKLESLAGSLPLNRANQIVK